MGKTTAIDLGSATTKVLTLSSGKHGLAVEQFSVHDAGESLAGLGLKNAVCGLAGRQMTLRYTQVPPSPDWQLQNLMDLEIQDMSAQSGGELSADYNLLPIEDEEGGTETVLLAFAKNDALEEASAQITSSGGSVAGHVPNCVALYNAYMRCGQIDEDATVCLANIGHETVDLAIVRGADLLFVRNLSNGGKVFDDAIAASFNVSNRKAEGLKKELLDLDPFSRGKYASGQAEKVTMAAGGAGSMIVSAIQSSLAFCRSQTRQADLQLDQLLICGGTARVRGIKGMLREALKVPVDTFDPFETVDTSKLDAPDFDALDANRYEAVVALGLAAGKLDEDLYQLEILPESVKRRRKFVQQTIWNIGAAVLGVALIAATAVHNSGTIEEASVAKRRVSQARSRANSIHTDTEELVAQAEASSALVENLADRAVPLDGVILTLRALQNCMPDEFWVTKIEMKERSSRSGPARRQRTRPVVVLEGSGKDVSGRGVMGAYTKFLNTFKAFTYNGVKPFVEPQDKTDASGNTTFTWVIDYRPSEEG